MCTAEDGASGRVRSPVTALRLRQAGVPIDVLNVGGLGAVAGRHQLYRNISASDEEIAAMRSLEELGTSAEIQIVREDHRLPFVSVDKR